MHTPIGIGELDLQPKIESDERPDADPMVLGELKPDIPDEIEVAPLFAPDSPKPVRLPTPPPHSPSPPREVPASSSKPKRVKREVTPIAPTLIDDLPPAWDAAHETFETLERCVYERKDLGLSREQDEMMICDCVYDKRDPDGHQCSSDDSCINRALFIECLPSECRAKSQCRNQRFHKRQYAAIEIVQTEMKGFGLRAAADLPNGSLIYEYIGEVVQEKTFRKRMQQYADEGIRHFYFMMLQKEEYIDATKKGGIGRFANHSCNPNSEVQKWVTGRRLRMGIFTKRDVLKGEEITFNYNVDRYGHDAQICYCGEPNCVGFIGGKTQTDVGTMNDLFIDALGIADEVEELQLKGSKKKKAKHLDEDFVPTLRPIEEHEVQKVAAAMRQSAENVKMMSRLLQRIAMTNDMAIHRQLMRMHGFGLMNMVLTQMAGERDVVQLALEGMAKWKLQLRNKIDDSNIEEPVRALQSSDDERIRRLAQELLEHWSTLETSYKIPRKSKIASLDEDDEAATTTIAEANDRYNYADIRRPQAWENTNSVQLDIAPVRSRPPPTFVRPRPPPPPLRQHSSQTTNAVSDRSKLDAIIAMAQQNAPVAPLAASESPAAESSRSGSRTLDEEDLDRHRRIKRARTEDDEERKEKRLTKVVGEFVVKSMSKYKEQMEHDTFKKYAKECTMLLVEKEKKGQSYSVTRNPTLSEEKKVKMKSFTKEYVHKLLKRLKEKGKLRKPSSAVMPSTPSTATPMTMSTPSAIIATPNGDTPMAERELVTDIFGEDEDEMDMDMELETDIDLHHRPPTISPSSQASPLPPRIPTKPNGMNGINGVHGVNGVNGGLVQAVKVDSFRPEMLFKQPIIPSLSTPSRTPTSGGPSPENGGR